MITTPENRDLLERSVGPYMTNRTDDIRKVETMLGEAGYKPFDPKTGPSGMSGPVLEKATRDFQRDHGLKQDGLIYTDGPTIKKLADAGQHDRTAVGQPTSNVNSNQDLDSWARLFDEAEAQDAERRAKRLEFDRMRGRTGQEEGGMANRPVTEDLGGPTKKGISQKFFDKLRKINSDYSSFPAYTKDLSDFQIETILHDEFFVEPQIDKLSVMPGHTPRSRNLVDHVFDTGVHSGTPVAGRWLQESIDQVTGSNLRTDGIYDGIIGSKTRTAFKNAIKKNRIEEINNKFSKQRLGYLNSRPIRPSNPGWPGRISSYK